MNVSLWYTVAFHTYTLFTIETCSYSKQCRFNMMLTRTCLLLNILLYIYVYVSLGIYAYRARHTNVYISGSKSSAHISAYIIAKHRLIGVRASGYTHVHNKIHVWGHIHTCNTHIYSLSPYEQKRRCVHHVKTSPVDFICCGAVTFLVYRRLNTEQNLSVSLQYQLPLDSSLRFVC